MKKLDLIDERSLLQSVSEGNEQAFRRIFDFYSSKLYNYAFRITDNEEMAEEIVMDAFMKIWTNRHVLSEINRFDSYLYTIVRNQAFNAIKRISHEADILKQLGFINSEYQHCTEETVIYKEYQHLLNHAVNNLPPQQRLVYSLSRVEGRKYDEIADQLKLSKNTVKAHLKKALSTLRFVFSNYWVYTIFILFPFP